MAGRYNLRSSVRKAQEKSSAAPDALKPKARRVTKVILNNNRPKTAGNIKIKIVSRRADGASQQANIDDAHQRHAATASINVKTEDVQQCFAKNRSSRWIAIYDGPRNLVHLRDTMTDEKLYTKHRDASKRIAFYYHHNRVVAICHPVAWIFKDDKYINKHDLKRADADKIMQSIEARP